MMEIRIENLQQAAGKQAILRGLSLTFQPGAVNVILGPNGAGKTTLLRLLGLLDSPAGGEIHYDGAAASALDRSGRTAMRRRIGFVFQAPLLLAGTVRQNLEYAGRLRRIAADRRGIDRVLSETGLAGREDQEARQLSGGEKQRLQLARVMLLDPELYLLDEPTANLDPLSVKNIEVAIQRLAKSGKTILLATHNLIQARLLAERIFFLKDGRLVQEGGVEEVLSRPISLDIAEFSAAENIISGDIGFSEGVTFLDSGKIRIEVASEKRSGRGAAVIRPEDILVSRQPIASSARNSFVGRIAAVVDLGVVLSLSVDCSGEVFTVFVTRHSFEQMNLVAGVDVALTFKATAVHLLPIE